MSRTTASSSAQHSLPVRRQASNGVDRCAMMSLVNQAAYKPYPRLKRERDASRGASRRRALRPTSWLLLLAFLWAQIATAAYACTSSVRAPNEVAGAAVNASPCADMAKEAEGSDALLCGEHCKSDAQHVDLTLPLPMPQLAASIIVFVTQDPLPLQRLAALERERSSRAPPPPHSILHCTLRT